MNFWNDYWTGKGALQIYFPRIFALVRVKSRLVDNFGKWEGDRCVWEIALRKSVFDWKVSIWENFNNVTEGIFLVEGTKDWVVWAPFCAGKFICKSFMRSLSGEVNESDK